MASYHRTQVLLEDWQYGALKDLAESQGASLSAMIRRLLTAQLRPQSTATRRKGLQAIAGIGRDAQATGKDHDRWLYGQNSEK